MNYVVEVRYTGADWADLVADMRSWLDRRQIETEELQHSALGRGIVVRVGFRDQDRAAAFAIAFSGRLESGDSLGVGAQRIIARSRSRDAEPAFSQISLMITRQQKADLRERGYTEEEIREMKPQEAHRVLGLID